MIRHLLLGWLLVSASLIALAAPSEADKPRSVDRDGDGRNETQVFYDGQMIARELMDLNGDGKTDRIMLYRNGVRQLQKDDRDHDGRIDRWSYYSAAGVLYRIAHDRNLDGEPDSFKYMEKGRDIVLREDDKNYDGNIDRRSLTEWAYMKNTKTHGYRYIWTEQDNDFDGIIDKYRVRGEKNPVPNKMGSNIALTPKEDEPPSEEKKSNKGSLWDLQKAVDDRAAKEQLIQKSRGSLNE
jgi:hypothetical protein